MSNYFSRLLCLASCALGISLAAGPEVRVDRHRILYYSKEYLRHSQYLQGTSQDSIVAWGWRILEWLRDSGNFKEAVPEGPKYRFSNGSCIMDLDGDVSQELIVDRYERESWKTHTMLWYERAPGQAKWVEHMIGSISAPARPRPSAGSASVRHAHRRHQRRRWSGHPYRNALGSSARPIPASARGSPAATAPGIGITAPGAA